MRNTFRFSTAVITVLFFTAIFSAADAANFTVSSVSQFQTALNTAATNGQNDTITVLGGTYNVNPSLTFSSNENFYIVIRGSGSPVLDGGNARRVLLLATTAANADITVDGLTIRYGNADYGGGLNVATVGADITVKNCTANDNTAGFVAGGINLFSNTGNVTVTGCSFSRNASPNASGYPYGTAGGLFIQTDGTGTVITMTGCTFIQNTAQRDAAGAMLYPLGTNSTVIAESNTFTNNSAKEAGGGCWIRCPGGSSNVRCRNNSLSGNSSTVAGYGGGTYIQIASGVINYFDNIHSGNYTVWQGGGLFIEHSGGTLNVFRNRFINNSSGDFGGGADIFLSSGTARVFHNIFARNSCAGPGGGLNMSTTSGTLNIFNNTLFLNTATDGGDVNLYFDNSSSSCYFLNNILYKSTAPALSYSGQQTVVARYSNIQGGTGQPWFGTGCIDKYPFFADTAGNNFHLQDSIHCGHPRYSPCIDAGNPSIQDSIISCNWGLGAIRSDMGAYGGKGSASIGIKKLSTEIPEKYELFQNYPNPFNSSTIIKFQISEAGESSQTVVLKIYDITGREVAVLVNENLKPGTYEITFTAPQIASGIYFCTMSAGDFRETKRMILLK
jgi:hypothetical protein